MDLPCVKCICFPVCKDTIPMRHSGTALMGHIQNELITKCSLLNDFIYFNDNDSSSRKNISVVMDYFRLKML